MDVLAMDARLSTLAALVKAVPELADTLQDAGPLTVFAPSNQVRRRYVDGLTDTCTILNGNIY